MANGEISKQETPANTQQQGKMQKLQKPSLKLRQRGKRQIINLKGKEGGNVEVVVYRSDPSKYVLSGNIKDNNERLEKERIAHIREIEESIYEINKKAAKQHVAQLQKQYEKEIGLQKESRPMKWQYRLIMGLSILDIILLLIWLPLY